MLKLIKNCHHLIKYFSNWQSLDIIVFVHPPAQTIQSLIWDINMCSPVHYSILDLTTQWVEYKPLIMSQSPKFMMELTLWNQFTTKHNILGNSGKYLNIWTKRGLKYLWNLLFNICITFSFYLLYRDNAIGTNVQSFCRILYISAFL